MNVNMDLHGGFGDMTKLEVETVAFEEVNTKVLIVGLVVAVGIGFLCISNPFGIATVAYLAL